MRPYILIIEDDSRVAEILVSMLDLLNWEACVAFDPRAALEHMHNNLPALILLDLYMPVASGIEICKQIKQDPRTRAIPVVMLTGEDSRVIAAEALVAGACEYVVKPIDFDQLEDLLRQHIP
jgi:two-component system, OmpR family, phosphate regulon response regulator PhoB